MIQSPNLRVLLALSSTLQRARVRAYLERATGIVLVGEAANAAQMVQLALAQHPYLLLCDLSILLDPLLAELHTDLPQIKAVLISTDGVQAALPGSPVPVIGYLPLNLDSDQVAPRLSSLIAGYGPRGTTGSLSAPREPARTDLSNRFTIVQNAQPPRASTPTGPLHDDASYRGVERRHLDPSQTGLTRMLTALVRDGGSAMRDGLTGVANTPALTQALAFLPRVKCPTAFISLDVRLLLGGPQDDGSSLRRAAAAIRANMRQSDLVCRVDETSFVLLVPALDVANQQSFLNRLRVSIPQALPITTNLTNPEARKIELGIAFWEFGIAPLEALAHCRQALRQR